MTALSFPLPIVLAGVAVLAALLLAWPAGPGTGFSATDYRAKPLLSPWELRALGLFRQALPPGYVACPQVRLADALEILPHEPARRRAALALVAMKSVDFAIIDAHGRVVMVIELDDRSHAREDRRARDALVDAVCGQCGIPLWRVAPGQERRMLTELAALPPSAGRMRRPRNPCTDALLT